MHWRPAEPCSSKSRRLGQSIVELGLILPTFMLLTLGSADLGRAFYESVAIQGAAEAGSLKAIEWRLKDLRGSAAAADDEVRAAIKASTNPDVFPFIQIQDSEITLNGPGWTPNEEYTITITRNFRLLTPFLGNLLGGSQTLTLRSSVKGHRSCPC
jgi:TadE-like protein